MWIATIHDTVSFPFTAIECLLPATVTVLLFDSLYIYKHIKNKNSRDATRAAPYRGGDDQYHYVLLSHKQKKILS